MPNVKVIIGVSGEGGGIDLLQEVGGQQRFRVMMVDHSPTFLNEDDAAEGPARRDSGWLATWDEALRYFEAWPWPMLVPMHVDAAFAERVLAAIPDIVRRKQLPERHLGMARWRKACGQAERM